MQCFSVGEVMTILGGTICPIPTKCPQCSLVRKTDKHTLTLQMPAGKQKHLGCKPLERGVLAVWAVCLTAGLPQSADGPRRQGKIQKLKLHSAPNPQMGRGMVRSDKYWPRRSHSS